VGASDDLPTPPTSGEEPQPPPFDVPVCPRCLGDNTPLDNRCRHCGAPAFGFGGYEIAIAQWWALGESASRRDPPLVVAVGGLILSIGFLVLPGWLALAMEPESTLYGGVLDGFLFKGVAALSLGLGLYVAGLAVLHFFDREPVEGADGA
jgi:hypothetical protein